MSEQQIAEKACVYAALILADEEIEVTVIDVAMPDA